MEGSGMKFLRLSVLRCVYLCLVSSAGAATVLQEYLPSAVASDLVPGADGFGPIRGDLAVASVRKDGKTVAWAFMTSDFVGTTGYSGNGFRADRWLNGLQMTVARLE